MERVKIPVAEALPGDYAVYISTGKPSGQVTRKIVARLNDKFLGRAIRVSWGQKKKEVIAESRVTMVYRDKETADRLEAHKQKEAAFREGLMGSLRKSWGG